MFCFSLQTVVTRLLAEKLPHINAHLQEYFIDVTLVTFNWFLTIFIDALPIEVSQMHASTLLSECSPVNLLKVNGLKFTILLAKPVSDI